jgi:hypothetical protein
VCSTPLAKPSTRFSEWGSPADNQGGGSSTTGQHGPGQRLGLVARCWPGHRMELKQHAEEKISATDRVLGGGRDVVWGDGQPKAKGSELMRSGCLDPT